MVGLDRGRPSPPPRPPELAEVFVYNMMIAGAGREQIVATDAALNTPPWGRDLIFRIFAAKLKLVGNGMAEQEKTHLRAMQVERLRRDIFTLRVRRDNLATGDHRSYVAYARELRQYESLLADVEGTKQIEIHVGVDVDVRVRSASMRVIANYTRDDFAEMGRELVGRG